MPDPSITGLRILRAVTATGSFTAAAETLGYTQSAVSKQMHTLELAIGTVLFRRTPLGVELTVAGQVLASRSATVLHELDAASRELSGLSDEISERVRLGAFPTHRSRRDALCGRSPKSATSGIPNRLPTTSIHQRVAMYR